MDLSIAVALGCALFLERNGAVFPRLRVAALVLAAGFAFVSVGGGLSSAPSAWTQWRDHRVAETDIAFIARAQGPALCEMLSLCYWAGKPDAVDTFGLGEAFKTHVRPQSDLGRLLDAKVFASLQFTRHSNFESSAYLQAAIRRNYRLDHTDTFGQFWVKR